MLKIIELLKLRADKKTICPSEVLIDKDKKDKRKMEQARGAARLLSLENKIEITQNGKIVGVNFKGPIRLRMKESNS